MARESLAQAADTICPPQFLTMSAAAFLGGIAATAAFAALAWGTRADVESGELAASAEPLSAIEREAPLRNIVERQTRALPQAPAPAPTLAMQESETRLLVDAAVSASSSTTADTGTVTAVESEAISRDELDSADSPPAPAEKSEDSCAVAISIAAAPDVAVEPSEKSRPVDERSNVDVAGTPSLSVPDRRLDVLRQYLRDEVPLIQFDTSRQTIQKLIFAAVDAKAQRKLKAELSQQPPEPDAVTQPKLLQRLIARRADVEGLQFRWGDQCQAEDRPAAALDEISKAVRDISANDAERSERVLDLLDRHEEWWTADATAALEQMLQVESVEVRLKMIEIFRVIEGPESGQAIARRALYDLEEVVRQAAIFGLHDRPASDYRSTLLEGLRYPWEVVAWNAADALAQLAKAKQKADPAVVEALLAQLDQPPPTAPYQDEQGNWRVRELASLGHLQNCVLCHAPSAQPKDRARGVVPTPDNPSGSLPQYYCGQGIGLVRADVTYLKQDFSVVQRLENAAPWPDRQRIDYLVRAKRLTLEEHAEAAMRARAPGNPHRLALHYALRELTGLEQTERLALR